MHFLQFKWRALILCAFVTLFVFAGCKKDDDNPAAPGGDNNNGTAMSGSFTINGDGYNNKSVNFAFSGATYYTTDQLTGVVFTGADSTNAVIGFLGDHSGTYNFSVDSNGDSMNGMILVIGNTTVYSSLTTGSVKITEYGNVGGYVKGTVTGTLINMANPQNSITVSGTFSAFRGPNSDTYGG